MRARIVIFILFCLLLLAGCGGGQTGIQVDTLKVTGTQPLTFTSKDSLILSPDGSRIAALVDNKIGIYTITGTRQADSAEISADINGLAWSADSQKVAFTEEFLRYFIESDLYVLQSDGNQQTLTPDDTEGNAIKAGSIDQADVHPVWYNLDGQIAFLRFSNKNDAKGSTISLLSIPSNGGEAVELAAWEAEQTDIYILDSSKAGWLLYGRGKQLYRFDPASKQSSLLFDNDRQDQYVAAARISADGNYLMLWITNGTYLMPYFLATDGKGELIPLSADPKKLRANAAGWAPDGSAFAFAGIDSQNNQQGLFLVQQPGATPKLVQSGHYTSVYNRLPWIDWAANNSLLLLDSGSFTPLLIQLGQ
ncbi:MAG TPA: hypothetical protein VFF78_07770 [Anaerolineaceae bacterium]|nr:hypothetical protein [Anaerolineaceae bacterium]